MPRMRQLYRNHIRVVVGGSNASIPRTIDEDRYEEDDPEEYEESGGMDRRLIFIISGVAAVVVVGLIILVTVILPSGSRQVEEPVIPPPGSHVEPDRGPPRQEVGDKGLCPQPATSETEPTESIVQEPPRKKGMPVILSTFIKVSLYPKELLRTTCGTEWLSR